MTLPPLPLIDGAFLIDNSTLELIQTCSAQVLYNTLHRKIASSAKPSLDFGSGIHLGQEYRYCNALDKPMTEEQKSIQSNIIDNFFKDKEVDEFEHRNTNFACEVLKRYNTKYGAEPFNVLAYDKPVQCPHCIEPTDTPCLFCKGAGKKEIMVEIPFSIDLYEAKYKGEKLRVIFTGRIDLPVMWDGKIVVMDNKTSSMFFGPQRFLDEQRCSNQYRGYCWAFEKATGRTVDGYAVNGIPTKNPPAKPKQGIDNWWNEWFVREITHLALFPQWREEWFNSACTLVDYVLWLHERGSFPQLGRFTRACENYGGCQYKDVCFQSENKRADVLESFLYKNNDWSPLELTKQTKK